MLEAAKNKSFEKIFAIYNQNLLKRRFHSIQVSGLDFLREKDRQLPLIIYANHSSWWDGLAAFQISYNTKLDSFIIMEEKQLRKLYLFRKLGAFSIIRENAREAYKSLNYAAELLKKNVNRTLWIFPQGEILPNDIRPLKFYNGLTKIVEKVGNCYVLPVAFRYEFLGNYKPEIFVQIGEPEIYKSCKNLPIKIGTQIFSEKLTVILDSLMQDVLNKNVNSFEKII